jgi:uncharacterized ion transporter superfamily protein YfcC
MLFTIIVFVTLLTYILPAGEFKRILIEGRNRVIPGSYSTIPKTPIGFLEMFIAIPLGFKAAIEVMFVVLSGGIMFGVMQETKAKMLWELLSIQLDEKKNTWQLLL